MFLNFWHTHFDYKITLYTLCSQVLAWGDVYMMTFTKRPQWYSALSHDQASRWQFFTNYKKSITDEDVPYIYGFEFVKWWRGIWCHCALPLLNQFRRSTMEARRCEESPLRLIRKIWWGHINEDGMLICLHTLYHRGNSKQKNYVWVRHQERHELHNRDSFGMRSHWCVFECVSHWFHENPSKSSKVYKKYNKIWKS